MTQEDTKTTWGWNGDEAQFPSTAVQGWEFWVASSDDKNQSDMLQARCEPELARQIDEMVLRGRLFDLPMKTRSDFVRWACQRSMPELLKFIGDTDETTSHYLLKQRQIMHAAQTAEMLTGVRADVKRMLSGLQVVARDRSKIGMIELNRRFTDFLSPVMELAGGNNYLMRLYVRELFGSSGTRGILEVLRKAEEDKMLTVSPVINNSEKAWERIQGEN